LNVFAGDSRDYVFLINLNSPNLTRGLSGGVVFLSSPVSGCVLASASSDVLANEFVQTSVRLVETESQIEMQVTYCGPLSAETSSMIFFTREFVATGRIEELKVLSNALNDGNLDFFAESNYWQFEQELLAAKREAEQQEKFRIEELARVSHGVQSGTLDGFGFLTSNRESSDVCIVNDDFVDGARYIVSSKTRELPVHLSVLPVSVRVGTINQTFLNIKLLKCGTLFADSKFLKAIFEALNRDNISSQFSYIWIEMEEVRAYADPDFRSSENLLGVEQSSVTENSSSLQNPSNTISLEGGLHEGIPQSEFTKLVSRYISLYGGAANELKKTALKNDRNAELRELVRIYQIGVHDWVGTISYLSTSKEGDAAVKVKIAPDIYVTTITLGDTDSVQYGSGVWIELSGFQVGESIRFSGQFVRSSERYYFDEGSITEDGAMTEPEWGFRFESFSTP